MNNKKKIEQRCLDLTRDFVSTRVNLKTRKYINTLVPICNEELKLIQSERPDFVGLFGDCSYAVEHFLIDFCNDGVNNNQSESRRANRDVMDIYQKYHDPNEGTIKDNDIDDAKQDIEKEITKISNISLSFDYKKFVEAFCRIFEQHYSRVDEYLSNEKIKGKHIKIGYLIEFHCDTTLMHAIYNNSAVFFQGNHKPFPLTKEIAELIGNATKLDFVIISQFNEGVCVSAEDVRIYEPKNMRRSLETQRITVFDKVYYSKVRKSISLEIKKDSE